LNPLRQESSLPFAAVPFDLIRVEHYLPALEEVIQEAKDKISALKANSESPSFFNTIVALENATVGVYDVASIYGTLRMAHGDPAMHALAKDIMPKLMALESDINLDGDLFARVQKAQKSMSDGVFSVEQKTLADLTLRGFRRNGGLLNAEQKKRLREIDAELSTLGPQFSENVLKATNDYVLEVKKAEELTGLPDSIVESAKDAARERGLPDSYVFTLQAPSVLPFLKYAENRELRRTLWFAFSSRALHAPHSNQNLVKRIATLRFERAKLLGYQSHAHFQMEERMAQNPERVRAFLGRLLEKTKPAADREMAELIKFAREESGDLSYDLAPWDYAFWANKLKEKLYGFDFESLRPYFQLEKVLEGAFEHARRLYSLNFEEIFDVPVYGPDVRVFKVRSEPQGEYMGLFYVDFFPRATKSGGAWCTRFKPQWISESGDMHRPHVSIVCNFTKPTQSKPALLTFIEVTTLFHEFGHALHSLLSKCHHRSLSGTSVYRDFVELPSQIMENWLREPESLALFARHFQTGELLPEHIVQKLLASDNFHAAYLMMRQLRFGFLDLAWYGQDPTAVQDVAAFENHAVAATDLFPPTSGVNMSCSFEHIFSGGYSAGYYGYKWAEVLDADAFEYFKKEGIFSRKVADLFRTNILERGGTDHPMTLYKAFRGREPDPDALLRRSGLI
jgi:peptidyl-dipeptidase Dcp